jgi:hypothetical protein
LQVTFEASREAVLESLPCEVTRTVPCYARLFILDAPESPAGAFRAAVLLAGGRYELQPRNVVVEGIEDSQQAALAGAFGATFAAGAVHLARQESEVTASVSIADGDVVTVSLAALRPIDAGMLRWDPWMSAAEADGEPHLVEFAPEPASAHAFVAKTVTMAPSAGLPRDSVWRRFRSLHPISACYAEGTMVFGERILREGLDG